MTPPDRLEAPTGAAPEHPGRRVASRLAGELPEGMVRFDVESRREFERDRTERAPGRVDAVVAARVVEDVVATLEAASASGVPVVPAVAATNTAGLTVPERGGIVLDLRGMDRIIELNEADLHAVIEPGVTFGKLHAELERRGLRLRIGYPMGPPEASAVANCLLDGLTSLSLPAGSMSEWITGVEAVLSDGTIVRTGTCAAGPSWCARGPLPDLTGLFAGFQGTTGVVTKLGIRLWPRREHRRRGFVAVGNLAAAFIAARKIARDGTCDDLAVITWPIARMALGVPDPRHKAAGEPDAFMYVESSADAPRDLARLEERVAERLADAGLGPPIDAEGFLALAPELAYLAELPARPDFLLDAPGGGLTWVGAFGPCSGWEEAAAAAERALIVRRLPPALVARPMREGHFGALRALMLFDRELEGEGGRIREAASAVLEAIAPLGFVPYKAPPWMVGQLAARLHPGFRELVRRVKAALDPAGVLNPGKWEV